MYKRLSSVMFPLLLVLLVGAIYWGYKEHQEKNAVLIKAENQYQRAFHDLTFHMDKLHQQLGNTLAVNSTSQNYHRKGLINAWRLSAQAQNEIALLPLSYLPFGDTEEFLSRLSNFAYKTSVRDLTKQPLTEAEFKTLNSLYEHSKEVAADLNRMQQDVLTDNLRWMDIELAIASEQANGGNIIVDGLRDVDKKIREYPELDWGPSVSSMYEKRSFKALSGNKEITAEQAKSEAAKLLGVDAASLEVAENGSDTEYATYSVIQKAQQNNESTRLVYTKHGGHLMMYAKNREVGAPTISTEQARQAADEFLNKFGFKDMKAVTYDVFETSGTFTYATSQNGVLIYPDKITISVALDKGEVLAMQAAEFVSKHNDRELQNPSLSSAEARAALNPNMKIKQERLAIIIGEMGSEVLCYEFTGRINGSLYRVYINAETGTEESIEQMRETDQELASTQA